MRSSRPNRCALVVTLLLACIGLLANEGHAYRVVYPGQSGMLETEFFNSTNAPLSFDGCHGDRGWPSEGPFDPVYIDPGTGGSAPCGYTVPDTAAVGLDIVWLLLGPNSFPMDTLEIREWVQVFGVWSGEGWIAPAWEWMGAGGVPDGVRIRRVSPAGGVVTLIPEVDGPRITVRDVSASADTAFLYSVVVPVGHHQVSRGEVLGTWARAGAHGIHLVGLERVAAATIRVRFIVPDVADVKCEVFDPQGRRVGQQWALGSVGTVELAIGLETPAAGIYFVRLKSREGSTKARVTLR
jgi:hypothetical protein